MGEEDDRINAIVDLTARIAAGDFSARGEVSPRRDGLDGVTAGLNMLAEHFAAERLQRLVAEDKLQDALDVYERAPGLFCTVDVERLRIVRCNQTLVDVLGVPRSELIGTDITDLCTEGFRAALASTLRQVGEGASPVWPDIELKREHGSPLVVVSSASLVPATVDAGATIRIIWRDATEERRLETALLQAQKMESVGRLAGGIAHDFNNLITIISGAVAYILERPALPDEVQSELEQIREATRHAARLTGQLLAFSRRTVVQPRSVNLNDLVARVDQLLRRLIGEHIQLDLRLAETIWPVDIDPTQFEQILMNLAVNARDAMPEGGTLTVETSNVELDEAYARDHLGVEVGPHVLLAVSDTGTGMAPAVRAQVFDPFFTTKDVGSGTGLGLSVCYGIIRQAGGRIWVYSEPGHGATFKVYLPRGGQAHAAPSPEPEPTPRTAPTAPVSGRVLVVEDEPMVMRLTVRLLARAGYDVTSASNGAEALEIARAAEEPFDLVLTDVIMPEVGGAELVQRLTEMKAARRALFLSGYTENAIVRQGVLEEGINFLAKPFTGKALLDKVRELITEKPD